MNILHERAILLFFAAVLVPILAGYCEEKGGKDRIGKVPFAHLLDN